MKKIILTLMIGICLISCVSPLNSLGIFKQNQDVRITQICSDATYINISSVTYPNSTVVISGIEMTGAGSGEFYYDFASTSLLGRYDVRGISDGCEKTFATYFVINYFGQELSPSQSTLYLGLLGILIFILFVNFWGMGHLPKSNVRNEEGRILQINYLKYFRLVLWLFAYFLFIAIIFLSSNIAYAFLSEQMFGKLLFSIFSILLAVSPVIIILLLISFFVGLYHDKEFQKLLNRGIFPGGNI